jgi:hypothetical protein
MGPSGHPTSPLTSLPAGEGEPRRDVPYFPLLLIKSWERNNISDCDLNVHRQNLKRTIAKRDPETSSG